MRLQYQLKKLDEEVNRVLDKFPHLKKKALMTVAEKSSFKKPDVRGSEEGS